MMKNYKLQIRIFASVFMALITPLLTFAQSPANDDCSNATLISFGITNGETCSASNDYMFTSCNPNYPPSQGVWFKVVGNGNPYKMNTCNSNYNTRIRVYSGDCNGILYCVAFNDDDVTTCTPGTFTSSVQWSTTNNTVYYALIEGNDEDNCGNFALNFSQIAPVEPCTLTVAESAITDFCQGGIKLTAEASKPVVAFNWTNSADSNFAATGASIVVSLPGVYRVTAAGGDCDGLYKEYTVTINPEDLLSAYTIIGTEEVHLHGTNSVLNGGVAALGLTGEIKLHEGSIISGATTFAKASTFEITGGSATDKQITGVPNITLPNFLVQSYGTIDIVVPQNGIYQATASKYKKITLRKNATITFTQENVSFEELNVEDNATVKFSGCTYVYTDKKLILKKGVSFNPDNYNVTVYVANSGKDKVEVNEGSVFNGNVYATGEVKAKGKEPKDGNAAVYTYMNGMFIGQKIHGDNYVTWNWDVNCNNSCVPNGVVSSNKAEPILLDDSKTLKVSAYPNPFSSVIKLEFETISKSSLEITVYTMTGATVEHVHNWNPTEVLEIGGNLASGLYIVAVTQDSGTQFVRIAKNN